MAHNGEQLVVCSSLPTIWSSDCLSLLKDVKCLFYVFDARSFDLQVSILTDEDCGLTVQSVDDREKADIDDGMYMLLTYKLWLIDWFIYFILLIFKKNNIDLKKKKIQWLRNKFHNILIMLVELWIIMCINSSYLSSA